MSHCQRLPSGALVHVTSPLTEEEATAMDEYLAWVAEAARKRQETRRAALSPDERDAEDRRVREAADRIHARVARLRGETP